MALLSIAFYLGEAGDMEWSPWVIIVGAAVFRLMFLFRPPELSDDIYRYLWDGLSILHGNNPYALAPSDAKLVDVEHAALLSHVNHPQLVTIYPPAAQIFFSIGAFLGGISGSGVSGIKALLVAGDIAVCAIIMRMLLQLKMPPSRALLYAWHPLPILEIAGSGHIDGAGVFFLMLAFMLLLNRQNSRVLLFPRNGLAFVVAGVVFSLAALTKLFPLVLFPVFLFLAGRKGWQPFTLGAATGAAALSAPFLPGIFNMLVTLDIYARNWEFAGFAFQALHEIFPFGQTARQILAVSFFIIAATLYALLFWKRKYPVEGDCTTPLWAAAFKTAYCIVLAFLLLTPTLHPWYALYLVCFLPFVPGAAGLVMTWAVLLSYRVLIDFTLLGVWKENDAIPTLIWGATVGALLLGWLASNRAWHNRWVVTLAYEKGRLPDAAKLHQNHE